MSMGKDYLDDMLINDMMLESSVYDRLTRKVWLTADNRELEVSKMADRHITNTIRWLENNDYYFNDEYIKLFKRELLMRSGGTGA